MLAGSDYNAADLAEHLRMDPTLATRVMSVANSAFFSRQPCNTIDDAVNRLGTVQLSRIFAQVLASAALISPLRAYGFAADGLWRRSVFAAVGAEMAAERQVGDRSACYMVGLLHQVGMLVINGLWTKAGSTVRLTSTGFEEEYTEDEKSHFGFDQAALGAELLRQLSFPESVCLLVGRQYRQPIEPLACALYMGRLVRAMACDTSSTYPDQEVLQGFHLTSTSQRDSFLSGAQQEAQNRMHGG